MAERKTEIAECGTKVNTDLKEIKTDLTEMRTSMAETQAIVMSGLAEVKEELLKEFRAATSEMLQKSNTSLPPRVKPVVEEEDIVIAGGLKNWRERLSYVEKFSWQTRLWVPLSPMKEPRSSTTSFVYNNQIFVAGGLDANGNATDSVEMMNIQKKTVQWETFPAKMPIKVCNHKTAVYQDRLIVVGGYDDTHGEHSDAIYEVLLTPPYSTKLLRRMPEERCSHGAELMNDKVFILGGETENGATDSVLMYDVARNKCKQMPPLLYAVEQTSTVSWKDKVILLGGRDKNSRRLNNVVMYDTVTGETEVLPSMKHKRWGSSAVVTADKMIIMGGEDDEDYLNSVECYNFSSNSWEELQPMIERRLLATAVVKSFS